MVKVKPVKPMICDTCKKKFLCIGKVNDSCTLSKNKNRLCVCQKCHYTANPDCEDYKTPPFVFR
jgi:hypothetical protein